MKHYPPEFKAGAVALYESRPGAMIKQIAAGLGVNPATAQLDTGRGRQPTARPSGGGAGAAADGSGG